MRTQCQLYLFSFKYRSYLTGYSTPVILSIPKCGSTSSLMHNSTANPTNSTKQCLQLRHQNHETHTRKQNLTAHNIKQPEYEGAALSVRHWPETSFYLHRTIFPLQMILQLGNKKKARQLDFRARAANHDP